MYDNIAMNARSLLSGLRLTPSGRNSTVYNFIVLSAHSTCARSLYRMWVIPCLPDNRRFDLIASHPSRLDWDCLRYEQDRCITLHNVLRTENHTTDIHKPLNIFIELGYWTYKIIIKNQAKIYGNIISSLIFHSTYTTCVKCKGRDLNPRIPTEPDPQSGAFDQARLPLLNWLGLWNR